MGGGGGRSREARITASRVPTRTHVTHSRHVTYTPRRPYFWTTSPLVKDFPWLPFQEFVKCEKVANFELAIASGREDEETGELRDATEHGTKVRVGGTRQPFVLVRCGEDSNLPVFFWRRHGKDVQTYDVYKGDPKMPGSVCDVLADHHLVKHWHDELPSAMRSWLRKPDHPSIEGAPKGRMWAAEEAVIEPGSGLAVMGILRRGDPQQDEPEFVLSPIREEINSLGK